MLEAIRRFDLEEYQDKNKECQKYIIEKIDGIKDSEKDKIIKQEMETYKTLARISDSKVLINALEYGKVRKWVIDYFDLYYYSNISNFDLYYYSNFSNLDPCYKKEDDEKVFSSLTCCISKQELEDIKKTRINYKLFFGIYSEYISEEYFRNSYNPKKGYHFIYNDGDLLIKRQVFSDEINIKRLFEINKRLNLRQFVFSALSLDDFTLGFWGLALRRYRNIEPMDFEKMKNFLRCQKCHATTKLTLDNFINSSLNTVEAYYKCPKCGEVYSFSKLKKIYEENMHTAY